MMNPTAIAPEPSGPPPQRAAIYARMSTEHQQYSTENQISVINDYALKHNIEIARKYVDEGKSGLTIKGRPALKSLIADVVGGQADFEVVLVYDVSRWGRFQKPNEAAHYEFLCNEAGVKIKYCAEAFADYEGFGIESIKGIQRDSAAGFSSGLSTRVFLGQVNLVRRGFHQGGLAGYGLRRLLIGPDRKPKGELRFREYKSIQTDHVILVPGPPEEVENVRWIYRMFNEENKNDREIAEILNARGIRTDLGRLWNRGTVREVLSNEKYMGNNVYNRVSFKLKEKREHNTPDKWIRADGAFEGIIESEVFLKAQSIMIERSRHISNDELLVNLKILFQNHGRLSAIIINEADGPSSSVYRHRFGGLLTAYQYVGYVPIHDYAYLEINRYLRDELYPHVVENIIQQMQVMGGTIKYDKENGLISVNEEIILSLVIARCQQTPTGSLRWKIRLDCAREADLTVAARMNKTNKDILDYYLLPSIDMNYEKLWLAEYNGIHFDVYRFNTLDYLFGMAQRVKIGEAA